MQVKYTANTLFGKFEVDCSGDIKEVMSEVSKILEVFGVQKCGNCGKDNLFPNVREVDGNKYYSIDCRDCYHSLNFGQHKKGGTLFQKRKDGWVKYVPPAEDNETDDDGPPKKKGR